MSNELRLCTTVIATIVLLTSKPTLAGVPVWARMLHWMSGDSDETTVPVMNMGDHMQMTKKAAPRPEDAERAASIVRSARDVLGRYPDAASAQRDGYRPFHTTGIVGEEIHYSSIRYGYSEGKRIDYFHPGSILFRRTEQGLIPVGVMYSAPNSSTAEELDSRAPLSIATWHRHVDFCLPPGRHAGAPIDDARFGYTGTIYAKADCLQAGGYWLPVAFGRMTHVYPDERQVWGGEEMDVSQSGTVRAR